MAAAAAAAARWSVANFSFSFSCAEAASAASTALRLAASLLELHVSFDKDDMRANRALYRYEIIARDDAVAILDSLRAGNIAVILRPLWSDADENAISFTVTKNALLTGSVIWKGVISIAHSTIKGRFSFDVSWVPNVRSFSIRDAFLLLQIASCSQTCDTIGYVGPSGPRLHR